ncbi:hypothetical protein GCM10017673_24080 [Streptosporangium violaceochromogenes]|nr:hypothetical protein GCM10017673_24080 [Streptosporangium violaceochromogenes]
MTDEGFGVVRPLPGNGLVAHVNGLLLVCDAAEAVAEDLLGALRDTAAVGGDGRALARRVARVLADMMGESVACAVAGPVSAGVAVLVSGPAFASVTGAEGEVRLAGRDALTWSDRLVPGPVTRVELRLPDAGEPHPLARLDDGVVIAGGVRCDLAAPADPAGAGAAPAAARPSLPETSSAPAARAVPPEAVPSSGAPPVTGAADPQVSPGVPPRPERPAPPVEAGPPAPYPMGSAEHYAPAPPEQRSAPPAWLSDPELAPPVQGAAPGAGPGAARPEEAEGAFPAGGGGEAADPRDRPFDYEPPGDAEGGPEPAPPEPQPESRTLVYGVDCKNDHFNDPRVPYCAVCGIALVQRTLVPYKGPRPPLGVLLLDDGMTLRLDTDYLVGRDPERAPEVADGSARPAKVTSPDGSVSRRHLRVALDGWDVNLVDLGSVNGTQVQRPGDSGFYDIPPNEAVTILPGTTVRIGVSRTMRYESHRNR